MKLTFEKRAGKLVCGGLLAILCPVSCLLLGYSVKAGLVRMAAAALMTAFRLDIPDRRVLTGIYAAVFLAAPCISFALGLLMQNINTADTNLFRILLNLLILLILQLLVLLIGSNIRLSLILGQVLPFLLILVQTYVFAFRGNSLTPMDFLSVRTAANVVSEYDFTPTATVLYATLITTIFLLSLFALPYLRMKRNLRNTLSQAAALVCAVLCLHFGSADITPWTWLDSGSLENGFLLNFCLQFKNIQILPPDAYSREAVDDLAAQYPAEEAPATGPDIIVIMDESFADFRVFGTDFPQADEIMPYIDSLSENTIRGFLTASVFGGSTANSEYEFLSGNTLAFVPEGSIVYQQYYSEDSWTLLTQLKQYGYHCIAMHPYLADGWMRPTVYPQMGFEELYFLDDFPQAQMIREYVSDREMFEYIISYHEAHDADTPLFLFGVTMQNHGGYAYEGADFRETVLIDGYPYASEYLSLAQETDRAVEYLIEYYKTVERDTVIVFFGDHMPKLESAFYDELNGGAFDTLDSQMKKQMVPFFVWANFDIEEQQIPCSSINYLPLYTMEAAGLPLSPFLQFLQDTEPVIPAINAFGYYSMENQCFLPLSEASGPEAEAISRYEILQYNNLFDDDGHSTHFFGK